MICLCKFEVSTVSPSIKPNVPMPAPARYKAAGEPKPPVPTIKTLADFNFSCPSNPISGIISYLVYQWYSSFVKAASIIQ